ncbi:polysaccharide deacetylase family protein [Streptomyces sp. NBC_01190]|uniref:polysaccharide deacetylase family protein n=1 Tax=Streptomyces sp. NBC_01190 TaxID=2903767 RepID=UPI0038676DCC|nr:polysaccharide deacetylase family protein [Streptomyces sp. NBC_01190]
MRAKALLPALAVAALLAALLGTGGCTTGPPAPAGSGSPGSGSPVVTHGDQEGGAGSDAKAAAERAARFRAWGVPLLALPPRPPAVKPVRTGGAEIPVISRVPTEQKIVFVTFDDGLEKDPRFVAMMRDLRIPFTMFLTDDIIKDDYSYFKPLQALGNTIQDHTLSHPDLPTESLARQTHEICAQQSRLAREYGVRPGLFRPPYGDLNADTRAAVTSCGGLRAIILWRETMQIKRVTFQDPGRKFHPGDIILAHFRGPAQLKGESMTKMVAAMLRGIAAQGYTVARLDDYV